MLSAKDAAIVYETLLSSPGMNDSVKVSLQLPRKNVLLLTNKENEKSSLLRALNGSGAEDVQQFNLQLFLEVVW